MSLDYETLMCEKQAITSEAESEHTFLINSLQGENLGPLNFPFFVYVDEAFEGLATLELSVQGAIDEAFTSPITISSSGAIPVDALSAGYTYKGTLDHHEPVKYLRFYFKPDVDATAGKVTAAFALYNTSSSNGYQSSGGIQINPETPAEAMDGLSPYISDGSDGNTDGNWVAGNGNHEFEDTGVKAQGPQGEQGETGPEGPQGPAGGA